MIEAEFGDCKRRTRPEFEFLGMKFKIDNESVSIKIDLSKILEHTTGSSDTPAPNNMLAISPDADPPEPSVVERFHSMVEKQLYVSRRTRPEILFSINFLCTRVQKPTLEDSVKLGRLLKYLNGSKDDELVLAINETNGKLKMEAYIDAAYGVHEDSKSHSGMMITLGKGTIMGVSSKQKCVSKSSTEAELIAVTDLVGQAMELRSIAQEK